MTGYLVSILPAGLLAVALLLALPRALVAARLAVHIGFFIFARDAMSPAGFWQLDAGSMRLTASVPVMLALAGLSASLFIGVSWLERDARQHIVRWRRPLASLWWGVGGAALISLIAAALKTIAGLPSLPVPGPALYAPMLVFALLGNAYEELLFRGMLQQRLMHHMPPLRAALVAALAFSLCHAWLASMLTHAGASVLVFTLVEGLVAGLVCLRAGLLGATLAHGLAIFVLAAGWY